MKSISVFMAVLCSTATIQAQKPALSFDTVKNLSTIRNARISDDGRYFTYVIDEPILHRQTLKVLSADRRWEGDISNVKGEAFFANESHLLITLRAQDTLCLQKLGKDQQEFIPHVRSFIVSKSGTANWLMYRLDNAEKELVVRNLSSEKLLSFSGVSGDELTTGDQAVILQQQLTDSTATLSWVDPATGTQTPVWRGKSHGKFRFTKDGKAMAFIGSTDVSGKANLWYYKMGDEMARVLFTENNTSDSTQGMHLGYLVGFNDKGDKLFFSLQRIVDRSSEVSGQIPAHVDIYGYKDSKLQSQQLQELQQGPREYAYSFDLPSHKLIRIERENEHLIKPMRDGQQQDFVLIRTDNGGPTFDEWNWNPAALSSVYLMSIADGKRKCLSKGLSEAATFTYQLSPDNKYVIYYDATLRNYCSYAIASGITRNITLGIWEDWLDEYEDDLPDSIHWVAPDYHWSADNEAVFIHSKHEICQADPTGKHPPIRLMGNYGPTQHLQFSMADLYASETGEINSERPFLLKVFNEETRDEGYCKVMAGWQNKPELLKMLPYHLDVLQKARDVEVYTVQFASAESSPNQFLTTDFETYIPLTDNHPEKAYNGMTSQLVHFKTLDGSMTQGILFKPENFNPNKKYPVIFEYYERYIVGLHEFAYPHYTDGGRLDIPTYVSNGYLVFTPDIHYKVGYPGRSAYNTIVGAAKYLSQFPWVDKAHMALMGHSFGGFETNYVIAHSHLFSAAASMSGMTDFVSVYGSIIGDGSSRQRQYELYRDRIGATLWRRPDLYLENSPVLKADQITTPVLIMANKKDDNVPYEQGVEFFTALRRLDKKAWMLQYDNGGHGVDDLADQKDLTIRLAQFLNYYLKGEAPPKWMVDGIPATEKGRDNGYELMPGRKP